MSLLKRIEHGGAAPAAPVAPPPGEASHYPSAPAAPEPTFRPNPIQSQVTEAQRSLKLRPPRDGPCQSRRHLL